MALNPGTNKRFDDGRRAHSYHAHQRNDTFALNMPTIHTYQRTWFGNAFREQITRRCQPSPIVAYLRSVDWKRQHIADTGVWAK